MQPQEYFYVLNPYPQLSHVSYEVTFKFENIFEKCSPESFVSQSVFSISKKKCEINAIWKLTSQIREQMSGPDLHAFTLKF